MNEMVHPAAFAAVEGGAVRVAVVEDDDALRDLLVADLADRGVLAYGVASAEELYRQMVVSPVDVVVLDLGLPGEDGHSVSRHLRRRGDVGIVVVTGRGGRRGLEQAMRNGADLFIAKPVDTDALVAAVEALHQACANGRLLPRPMPTRCAGRCARTGGHCAPRVAPNSR